MDLDSVVEFVKSMLQRHKGALVALNNQQSKILELAALMGATQHYKANGYSVSFINPTGGQFRVKTSTRGHPTKFSRVLLEKGDYKIEVHMNLLVRSARDEGIYCVDIAVIPADTKFGSPTDGDKKWECISNDSLITFAEVKKLVIYPMLIAQFIGIVHEIMPRFLSGPDLTSFLARHHFPPALISLGNFSGNSGRIVEAFEQRNLRIKIINSFDMRLSRARHNSLSSPFEEYVREETEESID